MWSCPIFATPTAGKVDFVVTEPSGPILLVECKWGPKRVDPCLRYLKLRFPATEAWQVSALAEDRFRSAEGIRVCPAIDFLTTLV